MTLDVVVTDKSGKPVSGLDQQNFTLLDNKEPRKILSLHAVQDGGATSDPPVEAFLILDEVNAGFSNASVERIQLEKFLKQSGAELPVPVTLVFFTDAGTSMGTVSSRDGNALLADLEKQKLGLRTVTRSQGFYGAGDRVQLGIQALEQLAALEATKPGRKLAIWISPGWPLLTGPRVELTNKIQASIFQSIVQISDALRRADLTIYSIDPLGTNDAGGFRTMYYKDFLKGVKSPNQVQIGNLGLQVIADQSGGRVLNSSNDIAGEIATCVNDASSFYVLSFESAVGDGPNDYHALEIKMDKSGLTAHTRTGYYAQPDTVAH